MRQKHQIDRCFIFYLVDDQAIDQFEVYVNLHAPALQPFIPEQFRSLHIFTAVCNAWFALHSINKPIFLDERRRMTNASAYMQLELIESSKQLRTMMQLKKMSGDELFIYAFFISIYSMNWLIDLMQDQNQKHLIEPFLQMDAIAEINNQTYEDSAFQHTLVLQKQVQHEIMSALTTSETLVQAFQRALHDARTFLMNHPVHERGRS